MTAVPPVPDHTSPMWLLARAETVPPRWRDRGTPLLLVPLLPEESHAILRNGTAVPALPPEDEELAHLVARGLSASQIAHARGMGERTAQRHIGALSRRIGARTREEAIAILAARGFGSARAGTAPTRHTGRKASRGSRRV